jgi:hypothetical protein
MQLMPLNAMQRALVYLAANLPITSAAASFETAVVEHLKDLHLNGSKPVPPGQDAHVSAAADYIKTQLARFFGGL